MSSNRTSEESARFQLSEMRVNETQGACQREAPLVSEPERKDLNARAGQAEMLDACLECRRF